jgi:hypothetical protein
MRYPKGTIAISEQADVPILRAVYRAGHVTTKQVYEYLNPSKWMKNSWDSFRWRVKRLGACGFVDQERVSGIGDVLRLGEEGELFLRGRESTVVERGVRSRGANYRNQIWHDIELFNVQLALRRAGVVRSWQHEPEIRSQNDFTAYGYQKDYDAIVTFVWRDISATVALEYERTAKSSKEYARICADINRETMINAFLYLVPNLQLQNFLLHALRTSTKRLYVARAEEFCSNPAEAELIDARSGGLRRLEDCLRAGGS